MIGKPASDDDAITHPKDDHAMIKVLKSDAGSIQEKLIHAVTSDNFLVWFSVSALIASTWLVFSSGEFSYLLTANAIMRVFSISLICLEIESSECCQGVSRKMTEIFIIISGCRLCAILPFDGYLPFDASGGFCYKLIEISGLVLSCLLLSYRNMLPAEADDAAAKDPVNHVVLVAAAVAFALICHPDLNNNLPTDIAWALSNYLQPVAIICQCKMNSLGDQEEPVFMTAFLSAQVWSAAISFFFWSTCFDQLSKTSPVVGPFFITSQCVQLMGVFYVRFRPKGMKGTSKSAVWKLGQVV